MESQSDQKQHLKAGRVSSLKGYGFIAAGLFALAYAINGIGIFGFYLSGRGDPGQLEGGLFPLVAVIGLVLIAYGAFELWLRRV